MSREHFVFIESNTTGTGRLAVARLLEGGHRVTFLTRQPGKYPFLADPHPGLEVIETETNDLETAAREVERLRGREPAPDVLLTFSEYYVITVAEVAARFGYPYLAPAAARRCRDKHAVRQALERAGLPNPWFRRLRSEADARAAAEEVTFPCVAKPPGDSSSKGVLRLDGPEELLAYYRELATWTVNDRGQPTDGAVLLEELLEGPEVSVETVSLGDGTVHTVGVCRKLLSEPPYFVELGHDFPARLPEASRAALDAAVGGALRAVGYDFGPAHLELRLTPRGPVVIEINPRLAGGMIPELVQHATGVDLLTVLLDLLRRRPVALEPRHRRYSSIRFLTADRAGMVRAVAGVEAARQLPGVREVTVTKGPGTEVWPAEHALHRIGYVITAGDDPERVAASAEEAAAEVRVEVEEGAAA